MFKGNEGRIHVHFWVGQFIKQKSCVVITILGCNVFLKAGNRALLFGFIRWGSR